MLAEDRFSHPRVDVVASPLTILVIEGVPDPAVGRHVHIDLVYVCRPVTDAITVAPEEINGFRWVPLGEVEATATPPEIPDPVRAAAQYARRF